MGWHRRGKFGIHTGRTLRRTPIQKLCLNSAGFGCNKNNSRHEYAIVKEVKFHDSTRRLSFDKSSIKVGVYDGELSLDNEHIIYSMNKHKRWLLPDMIKQGVEQFHWDESKRDSKPTKSFKTIEKELWNKNPRVTVVERRADCNISRYQPDCIAVMTSSPHYISSKPQRKPRKNFAHVADLKPKLSPKDDIEVCYEFLSPFPEKCWPHHKQHGVLSTRDYWRSLRGEKSWNKCKGRRNKGQIKTIHLRDDRSSSLACDDEATTEECSNYRDNSCHLTLGTYIDNVLKFGSNKNPTSPAIISEAKPSNTVMYGKGDAIYVENDDQPLWMDDNNEKAKERAVPEKKSIIVDKKVKLRLLAEDIASESLWQQFGINYIEDNVFPRKFIIKSDLNEILSNAASEMQECCMLFEVPTCTSDVVEANVAVIGPNDGFTQRNMVDIIDSELIRLSRGGPFTTKIVVEHVTAEIISALSCKPSSNKCYKKGAVSFGRVPVEFIHNICDRKAEIWGKRDAARYSLERNDAKQRCLPVKSVNIDSCEQLCCDICYLEEDGHEDTDFTSLLQCLHCFCNHCWTMYIIACLDSGQSCITCPQFKCKTIIGETIIWSRTNAEFYRRYAKLRCEEAIRMDQQIRHCPAVDCSQLAFINISCNNDSSAALPILCNCGEMWCFGCQRDAHWPASCEEAESFRKKCDDHESLKRMYLQPGKISSVQVKRCPFCSQPIEKGPGCQFMACRCGNGFCWECLSPWDDHDWNNCDQSRKELEDVELALDFGNARFKKYSKIAIDNLILRSRGKLNEFRQIMRNAKELHCTSKSMSCSAETSAKRRRRIYAEKNIGILLEEIFHFKYLGHLVIENTAAALAITKTKNMLKSLDKTVQGLQFIIQRLDEVFSNPEALANERNFENVKKLRFEGEKLIRNIHAYSRARTNTKFAY